MDLCTRSVSAIDTLAAPATEALPLASRLRLVQRAVGLLEDLAKDPPAAAQCGEALRNSPRGTASAVALAASDDTTDYDSGAAAAAALVINPDSPTAKAKVEAANRRPCAKAQQLVASGPKDQAEDLVGQLIASGDDAAMKCAKALKAQLADQKSEPPGHLSLLIDYGKNRFLEHAVAVAIAVFALLLALRLLGTAMPLSARGHTVQRTVGNLYTRVAAVLGAFALGALAADVSAVVTDLEPGPLWSQNHGYWASAVGLFALVLVCIGRLSARFPTGTIALTTTGLILATAVGAQVQYSHLGWRVLYLAPAALAALLVGFWAAGKLRVTIKTIEGSGVPAGIASAISASFDALSTRSAGSVYLATNAPATPPEIKFGTVPGSSVLSTLLTLWRAITPSNDLTVSGAAIVESDKAVRLSLNLNRGGRPFHSTTISSRGFWADTTKASELEQSSLWSDLSVAIAAWLLIEVYTLKGQQPKSSLNGATRWQGIALNHIAARRRTAGKAAAAKTLIDRACELDPINAAAQYSRLALRGATLGANATPQDYRVVADAIQELYKKGES